MQTKNEQAFSTMIGMSEGTVNSTITKNQGYDVIVTGVDVLGHRVPEVFTDFSDHPFRHRSPKVINSKGLASTAAGKHQILLHWWDAYAKMLKLPDFSPASQELYYMQQLRERKALAALAIDDFYAALQLISGVWASLPGKAYVDQTQHTLETVARYYTNAGGTIKPMVNVPTLTGMHPPLLS